MHPYWIALQFLQRGRPSHRDDNHGHIWWISNYSGRLVHRQRDGNAGEPSCGTLKRIPTASNIAEHAEDKRNIYVRDYFLS